MHLAIILGTLNHASAFSIAEMFRSLGYSRLTFIKSILFIFLDDQTRVILRNVNDKNKSDYINANYIRCCRLRDSSSSVQSSNESLNSVSCEYIFNKYLLRYII